MDAWVWIVIIAAAIAVIGFVAWTLGTKRRTERLQDRFGPEYERTMEQAKSRKEAESELTARMKHRQELEINRYRPKQRSGTRSSGGTCKPVSSTNPTRP